ncbi:MAG: M20/M25/M40 family metallo-hydrolase [Gemmatimonadetes bacterium]|nr:M20/M25/M40 family metallo-hydrolase [Gemmatimonadota bacterium]
MTKQSFALLLLIATPLAAQQEPRPVRDAAATITAADVERRLWIVANDSMGGRDTPSDGLNKTAQYVADEFRRFGLKPGGENGTYFQRYTIERRKFDATGSQLTLAGPSTSVMADFTRTAMFIYGSVPTATVQGDLVAMGTALPPDQVDKAAVRGKVVLLVADYTRAQPPTTRTLLGALTEAGAVGVIRVSNRDSGQFQMMAARAANNPRLTVGGQAPSIPLLEVRDAMVNGLGLDLAAIRGGAPQLRAVPGHAILALKEQVLESTTAPNTIGILEGTDPKLRAEYMIFSAHMDHIGTAGRGSMQCQAIGADSICNGADDDGSGTVGVLEVAEAFSQRGVRPKRSMIFMTVSGEEKGLWGSSYWAEHPTVPVQNVVADFNVDMIGRNWEDTVVAIGRQHSNLGQILDATAARHPELRMVPIDDRWPNENFYSRSDHFNFARKGIPILFFFTGVHDDYHRAGDEVPKIGFGKEARILQLLFYTSYAVAQDPARPQWVPESWDRIVEPAAKALRTAGR